MLCKGYTSNQCREAGSVPVYVNVYDLSSMNEYAYWFGLGVYHSGIQVYGVEYAFGSHDQATSGIFEGEPKQCEGFSFRKQILIGWTDMSRMEVRGLMEELAQDYKGTTYNLITRNCNHFCNHVCLRLAGIPIPSWINRLARIGFLCTCIVPANINSTKVGIEDDRVCNEVEIKAKLRSHSSSPSSSEKSKPSSSPIGQNRIHGRFVLPPSSILMIDSSSSS